MAEETIRILQLEDSEVDAELCRAELRRSGLGFEWRREQTREGLLAGLSEFKPDIVLADYALPAYDGLAALKAVRKSRPDLPFVFVSGNMGEDLAVESLKRGATDFVVKNSLARLPIAVKRALRDAAAAAGQRRIQKALEESEAMYRTLFESNSDGVVVAELRSRRLVFCNASFCGMFGYSREELLALRVEDIHPKEVIPRLQRRFEELAAGHSGMDEAVPCVRKDKTVFFADISGGAVRLSGGTLLMGIFRDVTARRAAEAGAAALLADQAALIDALGEIVYDWRPKTDEVRWEGHFQRVLGYSAVEIGNDTASWTDRVHPDDLAGVKAEVASALAGNRPYDKSYRFRKADGTWAHMHDRGVLTLDAEGKLERIRGVLIDVTEQARLREQFLQAQKMEAVGRLAGGVAHDFNNILTSILGFGDFLLKSIPQGDPRRDDAAEIKLAAQRAAALTRQLLVFSRQQVVEPRVLDADGLVADLMKMLRRIIGEDVALDFCPGQEACRVSADPGQLEQVVMNLVVNARDATPSGGAIHIATGRVTLGEEAGGLDPALMPGPYAVLSVSDTGIGMDEETLKRIFEPFFTTKGRGKGTGLGLSTVYGIVRQGGGAVTVESAPGKGSCFKVWLPSVAEASLPAAAPPREPAIPRGKETILILEDDTQVRKLLGRALGSNGYRILEAATSQEALDLCSRERGIDLLLSDVILSGPETGPEAAVRLRALAPKMRIVFMSGYTDDRVAQAGLMSLADAFVQKPIAPEALALKIREVLDSPPRIPAPEGAGQGEST